MPATQSNRTAAIDTALGTDTLLLRSFSINDKMGRMFNIELEMDSEKSDLDFESIVGTQATVRLTMNNGDTRYFNGMVTRFALVQPAWAKEMAHYRATLSPWLWLLTRTADCRIFQNMTCPDIILQIFKDNGFTAGTDYKNKLNASYNPVEYCVQYRETAFNFVSRLMEQEGIYYFFEHDEEKHTLVLADSPSAHDSFPGYGSLTFGASSTGKIGDDMVTDWIVEKEIQSKKYAMTDFNFTKPALDLIANDDTVIDQKTSFGEVFDYPGGYEKPEQGETYARMRIQELEAQYEILRAKTTVRGVATGCTFGLERHPLEDLNKQYLVTSMSLQIKSGPYGSGTSDAETFSSCSFSAMPFKGTPSVPFRPLRTTRKPMIRGPQTAFVVGPAGVNEGDIYTDQYGRVKLHFHWDRHDSKDDKSSCWVRVSQHWAGAAMGSMHLPRIGQEVIVEFLEGDPDRPIITGRVYNGTNVTPYKLPDEKTKSTVKTCSVPGPGSNEIRFEDKAGSEEIYIHAQKDQNIVVENDRTDEVKHDETITIGNDRTETVKNDENITINGNRTETVAKDESITINGGRTETVAKDEDITINGGRTESVAKDENITISGGRTETVTKDENITINGGRTESVAKDEDITISGGRTVNVTNSDSLTVGKDLTINATNSITITCGSASITLKSSGAIQINGSDVDIEGSGKVQASASSNLILKGSAIDAN